MDSYQPHRADEDVLRQCLERSISDRSGRSAAVVGIHRTRSDKATSYDLEILTVQLTAGGELKLLLKSMWTAANCAPVRSTTGFGRPLGLAACKGTSRSTPAT